jgi:hypothetical protein
VSTVDLEKGSIGKSASLLKLSTGGTIAANHAFKQPSLKEQGHKDDLRAMQEQI